MKILSFLLGFSFIALLFAKCEKTVFDVPASDIDIKLESSHFSVKDGDVVDLYLSVTNIGPDDVNNLEIRFKQSSNNLKFIDDNKDSYESSVWLIDRLEAATADTLIVTAQGQLPSVLPTVTVQQVAFVYHNENYDPNSRNNTGIINVAVLK